MTAAVVSRLAGLTLLMAAFEGGHAAAEETVTGTALYRERTALPPSAVFEATLEDVSRADAPAKTLGRVLVAPAGLVPIAFEIYDPARIDPAHSYAVRGRIRVDDRLWFTTRVEGKRLTLGPAVSTMMACPDGMATERTFFEALDQVRSYKILGEHLELLDAGGALLARFERRLMS